MVNKSQIRKQKALTSSDNTSDDSTRTSSSKMQVECKCKWNGQRSLMILSTKQHGKRHIRSVHHHHHHHIIHGNKDQTKAFFHYC